MTERPRFSSTIRRAIDALRAFSALRCTRRGGAYDLSSLRAGRTSTQATGHVVQAASMSDHLSALVNDLRAAIRDALLRSDQVVAAFAALEQMGHSFDVALDVTMHPVENNDQKLVLKLTSSDAEFLRTLKIAFDTTDAEYEPSADE